MASELKLPGKFTAGKRYWLDGATLNAWREALVADRVLPGTGLTETQGKKGRFFNAEASSETALRPFTVTLVDGDLAISSGAYQVGADGAFVQVGALDAETGSFAYFVINQSASLAVTSVELVVSATELDAIEVIGSSPVTGVTSNVLLAEVITDVLYQRRHGNFTLGIWQMNGDVARWPETIGGGT